jgi:hypothetical protein
MMGLEIAIDPGERNAVRRYIEAAQQKPAEEQIAFNEGVMCAAFALGAYIEGSRGLNADALAILERAFGAMTGVKIRVVHQLSTQPSGEG